MKRRKNVYKRYHYLIIAFMSVFSVIMMYPMAWMLVTSFKSNADIHKNKEKFFPAEWTVEGYRSAFEKAPIGDWLVNSASSGSSGILVSSSPGAEPSLSPALEETGIF